MKYLTLEAIKQQCVIDLDFTEDDALLIAIGEAAEQTVEQQVNENLADIIEANEGDMPAPLLQAMKLLVEYFFDNRGSSQYDIPQAFKYLCSLYRNYNK